MWRKIAFAFLFWVAAFFSVTQLAKALPLSPGGSDDFHDPYSMILLGFALLLLAIFNGKFFKK
jgi:hypothetical protein